MWEIRLHGRGGQGAVTSAELLAKAAIAKGKFAQAFPSFGPERRGAPVQAFVRVDEIRILKRKKYTNQTRSWSLTQPFWMWSTWPRG